MDLQKLRIIRQAAACGFNLTRAAKEMHTSQPGVSRQIRELEDELGVELFIRVGKRLVTMTEPGKEILEIACRILADVNNIRSVPARFEKNGSGALRIASDMPGIARLPDTLKRFHASFPDVRISVKQLDTAGVASALLHDEADVGMAGEHLRNSRDIATFPCFVLKYKVLVPEKPPPAGKKKISLQALGTRPLLTHNAGTEERTIVDNAFAAAGLKPNIILTADGPCLIKCAAMRMGTAIVCHEGEIREKDLSVYETGNLFGSAAFFLGVRRGKLFRDFELQFVHSLLPGLDLETVRKEAAGRTPAPYVPGYAI
ncbi:MAG: LysR family transcriptional regulator [Desulfovibrio sp.]|jgi:LysR family cys regulon transcriptional activator|nr:LysR family transcriptional regulator [Desulfovibrio sp.]